jgi:hypothetical protein
MAIFSVEGSGLIQTETGKLPSGDMTVRHTGNGQVFDIVNTSCNSDRGYWNKEFDNWVIFERFPADVLAEFEAVTTRLY